MSPLELRYMGPTPYRTRKEAEEWEEIRGQLILVAMLLIFAFAFFAQMVLGPRFLDPLIQKAQAAETPKTDAEWVTDICSHLDRYSNGEEFADQCAKI